MSGDSDNDDIGKLPRSPGLKSGAGAGPRVMDFRPSKGLAAGLKRVGGRNGISRLGRMTADAQKHGKLRISHKY